MGVDTSADMSPDTMPDTTVAVDQSAYDAGPASNTKCGSPQMLTFTTGVAKASGDTTGGTNDFTKDVKCGYSSAFEGPQH